jgi:hypothetical protein
MFLTAEQELQQAIERWLEARDRFHAGNQIGSLGSYLILDRRLLTAFAAGWRGDEAILADAYRTFRKVLVENHEGKQKLASI